MTAHRVPFRLALLIMGTFAISVHAQDVSESRTPPRPDDTTIRFDHLTIEDGLSQQSVYALLQDRHGFMWFGTQDGLNRYDGYTFEVYQHDPGNPGSLPPGQISSLLEDTHGMLWVGQFDGGLGRFDPGTETFTPYRHDPRDSGSLPNDRVWALLEDTAGTIWVGTEAGLGRYAPDTGSFNSILPVPDNPDDAGNAIYSLLEDSSGLLWLGTGDGLFHFDPAADTSESTRGQAFTRHRPDPGMQSDQGGNKVTALMADRQGTLWVGAWGMHRFDREDGTFEPFLMDPQAAEPSDWGVNRVSAIHESDAGVIWVGGAGTQGTSMGGALAHFDRASGTFIRYQHDPGNPGSLLNNNVRSIYQDRQGILWVGMDGGGLSRIDRTTQLFALYPAGSRSAGSFRGGSPRGMHLDRDDVLWIGTTEGVLVRYDRRRGVYSYHEHEETDPGSLLPGPVYSVHRDRNGTLWVSSGRGLSRYDWATDSFTHYLHDPYDPTSISPGWVNAIFEDRAGQLWIGARSGLNRFDPETETFTRYEHDPDDSTSIGPGVLVTINDDDAGQLWIGTADGLNRFDPETERFTRYIHDPDETTSLGPGRVAAIHQDPAGQVWIGTRGGLSRLEAETGQFTHYTSQNSALPNNVVYCVLGDEQGHLWMSTNTGLARLDPATERFDVFTIEDGLQRLEFDLFACHKGYDGELFFGGIGGVNAVRPGAVFDNPHPPEVALIGLRLFNESISPGPGSPLTRSITETSALTFAHNQNDLTLEYVGLHFRHPEQNRYAYMLEGYDRDWRDVGSERRAVYTNLPHGRYTFRVKASNSDGVWAEDGVRLAVTIRPPWWRTWWAYALYGMLLLASIVAVDRVQRRRIIARERQLAEVDKERLRAEAAERELEQAREIERAYMQLKSTQAQLVQQEKLASLGQLTAGIAHEIKNPLNFVTNFADLSEELADEIAEAAENGDELGALLEELKQTNRVIGEHGRRADVIVQSMMQHARASTGERETVDLNRLVAENVALAYSGRRAQQSRFNVNLTEEYDDLVGAFIVQPQELGRVVVNLVTNAFDAVVAYASGQPDGNGEDFVPRVSVSTRRTENAAEIRVADNGGGIPDDLQEKIFEPFFTTKPAGSGTGLGLSLSYDIVTQGHGGALVFDTETGRGSTFIVTIPAPEQG